MREQDVPRLANAWYELLTEYKERSLDFAEMLLRIVGVYVGMLRSSLMYNVKYWYIFNTFMSILL